MPPGKMLFVVISRSLCECHINAKPASLDGEFAIVPEGGVLPVVAQLPAAMALGCWVLGKHPVARMVAFGPRYGLPPYQGPLVKMFGSGSVTGPPLATSPNGMD